MSFHACMYFISLGISMVTLEALVRAVGLHEVLLASQVGNALEAVLA